jgi:hypothetical protein
MKFLADQDVYASTIRYLSNLGHDVVRAAQLGQREFDAAADGGDGLRPGAGVDDVVQQHHRR